jgi:hypothetical protein
MMPEPLACSAWPRFGGDIANRSNAAVVGPHTLPTLQELSLPNSTAARVRRFQMSGVVTAPDTSLRICHAGMLSAWGPDLSPLWQVDLAVYAKAARVFTASLPTTLYDGSTLIVLPNGLLRAAPDGADVEIFRHDEYPDDSGMSPNVTSDGRPVLSFPLGGVDLLTDGAWKTVGGRVYGYDIMCPAVYDDGSLAIAGYYGTGFCRVDLDGRIRWRTELRAADCLPSVNQEQVAAVGSLNDHVSQFFAPDGSMIGRYPRPAIFAAYGKDWIALAKDRVARVSTSGEELWAHELSTQRPFAGVVQPVVDADGYIYVRHDAGVLCCDGDGETMFDIALSTDRPNPVSLIAPGVLALIEGNSLFTGSAESV